MKCFCGPICRTLVAAPDFIRGYKYQAPNGAHAHCENLANSYYEDRLQSNIVVPVGQSV